MLSLRLKLSEIGPHEPLTPPGVPALPVVLAVLAGTICNARSPVVPRRDPAQPVSRGARPDADTAPHRLARDGRRAAQPFLKLKPAQWA